MISCVLASDTVILPTALAEMAASSDPALTVAPEVS
jgi:hypothetical protein